MKWARRENWPGKGPYKIFFKQLGNIEIFRSLACQVVWSLDALLILVIKIMLIRQTKAGLTEQTEGRQRQKEKSKRQINKSVCESRLILN